MTSFCVLGGLLAVAGVAAHAPSFRIVGFGDSLIDNGASGRFWRYQTPETYGYATRAKEQADNAEAHLTAKTKAGYNDQRWSDGGTMLEYLSMEMEANGFNMDRPAIYGTGSSFLNPEHISVECGGRQALKEYDSADIPALDPCITIPAITTQVDDYLASGVVDPIHDVIVLTGGGNDLLEVTVATAAEFLGKSVQGLASALAKLPTHQHVFVVGVPPTYQSPYVQMIAGIQGQVAMQTAMASGETDAEALGAIALMARLQVEAIAKAGQQVLQANSEMVLAQMNAARATPIVFISSMAFADAIAAKQAHLDGTLGGEQMCGFTGSFDPVLGKFILTPRTFPDGAVYCDPERYAFFDDMHLTGEMHKVAAKLILEGVMPVLTGKCVDSYLSPNSGACAPFKQAGQYCNVVQACAPGFACTTRMCQAVCPGPSATEETE